MILITLKLKSCQLTDLFVVDAFLLLFPLLSQCLYNQLQAAVWCSQWNHLLPLLILLIIISNIYRNYLVQLFRFCTSKFQKPPHGRGSCKLGYLI